MQNLAFGCKQNCLCLVRVCFSNAALWERICRYWLESKGYEIGHLDICIL